MTGLDWGNAERRPKMLSSAGVDVPLMVTGIQVMGVVASLSEVGATVVMEALAVETKTRSVRLDIWIAWI